MTRALGLADDLGARLTLETGPSPKRYKLNAPASAACRISAQHDHRSAYLFSPIRSKLDASTSAPFRISSHHDRRRAYLSAGFEEQLARREKESKSLDRLFESQKWEEWEGERTALESCGKRVKGGGELRGDQSLICT